jgi:hypothetical protein
MVTGIPQRALRLGSATVLCLGLVMVLAAATVRDDADAARRPLLKTLWAVADTGGGIAAGESKGVVSSGRTHGSGVGGYSVTFNRDVRHCAKLATIMGNVGEIFTRSQSGFPRSVEVFTYTSGGSPQDRAFSLAVHC